jgi:hypothetical protein
VTDRTHATAKENELAALVGPFWSHQKTRSALGLGPAGLTALRDAGGVLELVSADGVPFYPAFQFERAGDETRVRPALALVIRVLRGFDPWAVAVLLHTPAAELDDSSPLAWLKAGGAPGDVEELAKVVAREWSAGSAPGSD